MATMGFHTPFYASKGPCLGPKDLLMKRSSAHPEASAEKKNMPDAQNAAC